MAKVRSTTRLATTVGGMLVTGAAAVAVTYTSSAAAQEGKLYAGAGLALTDFDGEHDGIGYGDTPLGWQVYGGLQARERMGVELALERFAGVESGDVLGSGVDRLRISADVASFTVRGVFSLSLEDVLRRRQKITLFGTVGLARLVEERQALELATLQPASVSERETAFVLGAGVTFEIKRVRLRTYLQSADRKDGSLTSVGAAAEFRF